MNPVANIDGYGDRDDIALEKDRFEGIIRDNKAKGLQALQAEHDWGSLNCQRIVDLIVEMIERGTSSRLGNKSDIFWGEIESISEAVLEACIVKGLDEDLFSPSIRTDGFEYEIRLY